jgi:hypothetical protein
VSLKEKYPTCKSKMHISFQTFITKQKIDDFYSEHPVVVIFKLSHCVFQYISNKTQLYTVYLHLETALHLSGGTSIHHQECTICVKLHLVGYILEYIYDAWTHKRYIYYTVIDGKLQHSLKDEQ